MRLTRTVVASIIIAFLSGLWVLDAQSAGWDGQSPVDFPLMEKGDAWVFKGFSSNHGADIYREKVVRRYDKRRFTLHHSADKSGRIGTYTVDLKDHERNWLLFEWLDYPLSIGKKWRVVFVGTSTQSDPNTYINKYKVLKVETKSVKAGKFKTFKIRMTQTIIGGGKGVKYLWYAPDVKRIILTKPNWRNGEELISYQLAGQKPQPKVPLRAADDGSLPQVRKIIFTRALDENNKPEENAQKFLLARSSRFYVYVKWDNLTPGRTYHVYYALVGEKGAYSQTGQIIEPAGKSHVSWHRKYVPETAGSWRIEIHIRGNVLGSRSFEVIGARG